MPGRKPKPLEVHERNGNPSRKNLEKEKAKQPRKVEAVRKPPARLSAEAVPYWVKLFDVLESMRVMSASDECALAMLCETLADYERWTKRLRDLGPDGDLLVSEKGYVSTHPLVWMKKSAYEKAMQVMTEFGLTPASRTRINVENETQADGLLKFVGGLN